MIYLCCSLNSSMLEYPGAKRVAILNRRVMDYCTIFCHGPDIYTCIVELTPAEATWAAITTDRVLPLHNYNGKRLPMSWNRINYWLYYDIPEEAITIASEWINTVSSSADR